MVITHADGGEGLWRGDVLVAEVHVLVVFLQQLVAGGRGRLNDVLTGDHPGVREDLDAGVGATEQVDPVQIEGFKLVDDIIELSACTLASGHIQGVHVVVSEGPAAVEYAGADLIVTAHAVEAAVVVDRRLDGAGRGVVDPLAAGGLAVVPAVGPGHIKGIAVVKYGVAVVVDVLVTNIALVAGDGGVIDAVGIAPAQGVVVHIGQVDGSVHIDVVNDEVVGIEVEVAVPVDVAVAVGEVTLREAVDIAVGIEGDLHARHAGLPGLGRGQLGVVLGAGGSVEHHAGDTAILTDELR